MDSKQKKTEDGTRAPRRTYKAPAVESEQVLQGVVMACTPFNNASKPSCGTLPPSS